MMPGWAGRAGHAPLPMSGVSVEWGASAVGVWCIDGGVVPSLTCGNTSW